MPTPSRFLRYARVLACLLAVAPLATAAGETRVLARFKTERLAADTGTANLAAVARGALAGLDVRVEQALPRLGMVAISSEGTAGQVIEALYRSGAVVYAEPDQRVRAAKTPDDPSFPLQWGLNNKGQSGGLGDADIDAPEAWSIRTAANGVVVGILDSGVDYGHPDLAANIWSNPGEIPGNGLDDDGNGHVDDVHGIDRYNRDSDPMDDHGHGTHVAGILGAVGNNARGITGVAWQARIMPLKFLNASGNGYVSDAIALIDYAIGIKAANGYKAMILTASWSGGGYSQALRDALDAARQAGILFVAAAGNGGRDSDRRPAYPAGYDPANIVAVAASDHEDRPAGFSNWGCASVDLFAPGAGIYSTLPGDGYDYRDGTSAAAAHVAGAAALLWGRYPSKSWKDIKRLLLNGADYIPDRLAGLCGTGARLNLRASLDSRDLERPVIWRLGSGTALPGDTLVLQGHRFGATPGSLAFQGMALDVVSWGDERIVATLPDGIPLGSGQLTVRTAAGLESRTGRCLTVVRQATLAGRTLLPRAWAAGARVGADQWILGGLAPWGVTGLVEKYSPADAQGVIHSTWSLAEPVSHAGAAAIATRLYLVGGLDGASGETLDRLRIFDTTTGTWREGAPLPAKRALPAVAALPDGKLYVFGGADELGQATDTSYAYDPAKNTWTHLAPLPTAVAQAAAIPLGTKKLVWIVGGQASTRLGDALATVQSYNAELNTWARRPALNHPRAGGAGAYYKNQPHLLFGGDLAGRRDGEWFAGDDWVAGMTAEQGLRGPTAGVYDGIWIFGGYDDRAEEISANVWRFRR